MNVLVTGCAGFIAAKVSELLLDQGHDVVGVDNVNDAYDTRLKDWRLSRLLERTGFSFHRFDITDRDAMASLFDGQQFDAVINLAARAGVRQSLDDPWVYLSTNAVGTTNLLDLCRDRGISKFVLASTSSLYGQGPRPFQEDQPTDRPLSPYAASKKAAEAMAYTYHHLYGLDVSVLRFFTVYGPAGRPDMSVFRFVKWIREGEPLQLSGDGSQERDFTYVDDIARGVVSALTPVGHQTINLGSDRPVPLTWIIGQIEQLTGEKAKIEYYPFHAVDVMATWADVSRARETLGWEAQVSLEEGLRATVEWYEENRSWAKDLLL